MGTELSTGGEDTPSATLAELVRALRGHAGLTRGELATRAGLSVRTVGYLESGRVARPQQRSLEAIAAALVLDRRQRNQLLAAGRPSTVVPAVVLGDTPWQPEPAADGADPDAAGGGPDAVTLHARRIGIPDRRLIVGQLELRYSPTLAAAWARFEGFQFLENLARQHAVEVDIQIVRESEVAPQGCRDGYFFDYHWSPILLANGTALYARVALYSDGEQIATGRTRHANPPVGRRPVPQGVEPSGSGGAGRLEAEGNTPIPPVAAERPPSGVLVGYGRVSIRERNLARQRARLTEAGCARCFFDEFPSPDTDRPELARTFEHVRPGDVLVVVSLDRLGLNLEDLIRIIGQLQARQVGFRSLHERLDTNTPGGMFVFHVFAALAEFIRTIIATDGPAVGRGRPPSFTPEKVAYALRLLAEPEHSIASIASLLGVSRATLYAHLPELRARLDSEAANPVRPAREIEP
ncbi:recombinase family protein [Longispora fulva]|uniref:DNA invertase Pin-like site-specific DNA recombinase/transcriptional regulator with XRE-family HTH domain n=1 Tax=Longispora fulva TaxID=619741 RepID=A0A8J7GGJ4_9ACTN|nr:recombinase family protein [Longispora fulva]MBG6136730.1 DNA invertase Pin-like site-specific DNA recombinase/transcriptional regulator with XRE-family HTH domain [Longispora fulva]